MTHREALRHHHAMHPDSTPISISDGATSLHATWFTSLLKVFLLLLSSEMHVQATNKCCRIIFQT